MTTDQLRLFLEQDKRSPRPRFQGCDIEPAFFTIEWKNLGAAQTPNSANMSAQPFLCGQAVLCATTANTDAAYIVGSPFLVTLKNQAVSQDVTNVQTDATALFDYPSQFSVPLGQWMYPMLVEGNGQILATAANPSGTNVNLWLTFHGVNLFVN